MAGDTWYAWTTGTSSATTTAGTVWLNWTSDSTTAATVNDNATWIIWNTSGTSSSAAVNGHVARQETSEERTARIERQAEQVERYRIQAEEEKKRREAAEKVATTLLKRWLDEEQRKQHAEEKKFHVIGSDGNRYEVDCTKRQHNVFELDANGKRVREYCIYQTGDTPLADNHLGQKLLLEADEKEFKRIANMTRIA